MPSSDQIRASCSLSGRALSYGELRRKAGSNRVYRSGFSTYWWAGNGNKTCRSCLVVLLCYFSFLTSAPAVARGGLDNEKECE
ncbi:hypothetical protein ANCCAN_02770 [Ancylostoma caninum]|uniref:Uncharacterized protein n=1 Tax=Ancylostoma caninum TaxID=29170 RepID=A0A368H2Z6_ANCCA|nr:hypothetical protein ANCCAN_02770 [Ancylostoma caninum]